MRKAPLHSCTTIVILLSVLGGLSGFAAAAGIASCSADRRSGSVHVNDGSQENTPNVASSAPYVTTPIVETRNVSPGVPATPWDAIHVPVHLWRDSRFEVFSWDCFPEILIFDISTFAMQDKLFKRLAFFVEKAGFRGTLHHDSDIAQRHAWNAHNYRAEDLADFFNTARQTGFPLLDEEWELEALLLQAGIIRKNAAMQIVAGTGAVLSLSQESSAHAGLRERFMVHEGFHGLFFIDEDFRNFSRQRWEVFPDFAKTFLLAYLNQQSYDITWDYLVINEFMAHVLQLPISQVSWYFGQFLPTRVAARSPNAVPLREERRDGGRFWPELANAFTAEAEAFSSYVNERWGFAAGRVW